MKIVIMNKEVKKMDMYQKRRIRAEKKNSNQEEKLTKVGINWYPGHMAKTRRLINENLGLIDIVIELVDSRIPFSSRIKDLDDIIKSKPKLMIMTKKDLCDLKETNKWIKYYEKQWKGCELCEIKILKILLVILKKKL